MPPNRKNLFDLAGSVATLSIEDIDVSQPIAKFAPLTSSFEDVSVPTLVELEQKTTFDVAQAESISEAKEESSPVSYWDWEEPINADDFDDVEEKEEESSDVSNNDDVVDKDALIKQILEEDRVRLLFSADRLEINLVVEAEKITEDRVGETICDNGAENVGYWDAAEEEAVETITANHASDATHPMQSYWDWDTVEASSSKETIIASILEEERIRQLLSVKHVEELLVNNKVLMSENHRDCTDPENDCYWDEGNAVETITASHVSDVNHPLQSYWEWETEDNADNKKQIIANILEEERNRQILSVERAEEQLLKTTVFGVDNGTKKEHDSYWGEGNSDEPTPSESYWNWQSPSPEEEKSEFIQSLMKAENIRKQLTIESIQEQLVTSCGSAGVSQVTVQSETSNLAVESYWDF